MKRVESRKCRNNNRTIVNDTLMLSPPTLVVVAVDL